MYFIPIASFASLLLISFSYYRRHKLAWFYVASMHDSISLESIYKVHGAITTGLWLIKRAMAL